MDNSINKRVYPRIRPFNLSVDLIVNNTGLLKKVRVQNISKGGASLSSNAVMKQSDLVQIKFSFLYDILIINSEIVRISSSELAVKFAFKNDRERDKFHDLFEKEIAGDHKATPIEGDQNEPEAPSKNPIDFNKILDPDRD